MRIKEIKENHQSFIPPGLAIRKFIYWKQSLNYKIRSWSMTLSAQLRIVWHGRKLTHPRERFVWFSKLYYYSQQPSQLLYSIVIWPARNSRQAQRETNYYIARCASVLAWSYLARRSREQLVIDLFAQHQRFAVCCPLLYILME